MTTEFNQFKFIDIHYHANPDLYKRRHYVLEVGREYQRQNGAVVLKSHLGSTAIQATIAQQEGLPVFPSIVLNHIAGGINYRPVLQALAEYQPIIPSRLIVHLPTITGRKHQSTLIREKKYPELGEKLCQSETIFNSQGQLRTEVIDLLKLSRDYPILLSTGHASREEAYALAEACQQWNASNLLLNQPAHPLMGLNAAALLEITQYPFVWVEQTSLTYLLSYQTESDFCEVLKNVPRVIYSSDLGQVSQMNIKEWLEISEKWFSKFNVSSARKDELCLINPAQLLKI